VNRAVFFDRDGVLNRVVWRNEKPASPRSVEEFELEPEARGLMVRLKAEGFKLFVVTNQPDIRRGLMSDETLDQIHAKLAEALPVDAVSACRHDDRDGCLCRKPKPGQLIALAQAHDVDLERSFMIGDQDRDAQCGRAAGCTTLLLDRSYNTGASADHVVQNLSQAVEAILLAATASPPVGV
jgi:D-glycero-D-manno-heptose 1,7-bisphosphate phosphatase